MKNHYILLKGSVAGPRKAPVLLTKARRLNRKHQDNAYSITNIINK